MTSFSIYIPTFGRARPNLQRTYESLPGVLQEKTVFVVRPEEKKIWHRTPHVVCAIPGVPAARHAAMEHAKSHRFDIAVMLDDDLKFSMRTAEWTPDKPQWCNAAPEEVLNSIIWMVHAVDGFLHHGQTPPLAARGPRGGNNSAGMGSCQWNVRIMRSFAIHVGTYFHHKLRFDEFPFWEDFHIALELLTRGYPNVVSNVYLTDGVTNSPGGVSSYRNIDHMNACQRQFVERWSRFVTPVHKPTRWPGMGDVLVPDLRIQWKKAYVHGQTKRTETNYEL